MENVTYERMGIGIRVGIPGRVNDLQKTTELSIHCPTLFSNYKFAKPGLYFSIGLFLSLVSCMVWIK
jgi:hypothetical protein